SAQHFGRDSPVMYTGADANRSSQSPLDQPQQLSASGGGSGSFDSPAFRDASEPRQSVADARSSAAGNSQRIEVDDADSTPDHLEQMAAAATDCGSGDVALLA